MKDSRWALLLGCILASAITPAGGQECPENLTTLEKDGLVAVESGGEARFQQLMKCGKADQHAKFKKVESVKVKSMKCECYSGNWEGYRQVSIPKSFSFRISESEPKEDCRLGSTFVICQKPGPCYRPDPKFSECSMPKYDQTVCRKECLSWTEKKQ